MRTTLLAAILLALPSLASAHILMTSPTPRSDSDSLKTGPCGNVAPTGSPAVFGVGETITLTWLETVDHPGYYRVAFSPGGDAGYDDNVLLDDIADVQCTSAPCPYEAQVVLPTTPCQGCSLQLIQYMGTAPPYSLYFSCADITLLDGPLPDGGIGGGNDDGGGCCNTAGGGPGSSTLLFSLLALAVLTRRRARRLPAPHSR
jgi:uncharacterized protein (TIGR03382 family)